MPEPSLTAVLLSVLGGGGGIAAVLGFLLKKYVGGIESSIKAVDTYAHERAHDFANRISAFELRAEREFAKKGDVERLEEKLDRMMEKQGEQSTMLARVLEALKQKQ